jgi:hypothetical protein
MQKIYAIFSVFLILRGRTLGGGTDNTTQRVKRRLPPAPWHYLSSSSFRANPEVITSLGHVANPEYQGLLLLTMVMGSWHHKPYLL